MMQRAAEEGQQNMVNALAAIQERAAELSTYGQELTVTGRTARCYRSRNCRPTTGGMATSYRPATLSTWRLNMPRNDDYLQAIVGLIRSALDYQFFQELSQRIDQASGDEQRQAIQPCANACWS